MRLISLRAPDAARVTTLVESVAGDEYSYPEVGATRGSPPRGYNADRYATVLGNGDAVFAAARAAVADWVPFRIPWIHIYPQARPAPRVAVAVVIRLAGLWWINISRVIYTIEEPDAFGFAYGTLQDHAECGEEQFLVRRDRHTDQVHYAISAFSRPRHPLARLGKPLARAAQRRFGAASLEAMRRATAVAR